MDYRSLAPALALVLACKTPQTDPPSGKDAGISPDDVGQGVVDGGGPGDRGSPCTESLEWLSAIELAHSQGVILERVTYCSQGLRIDGQVCRPSSGIPGTLLLLNHAGASGLGTEWANLGSMCAGLAKLGYVVLSSSYRGEDRSEGSLEICLGELDDVLRMADIGKAQPYVNPARTAAIGMSHGACLILAGLALGRTFDAAVAAFPPSQFIEAYHAWQRGLAQPGGVDPVLGARYSR